MEKIKLLLYCTKQPHKLFNTDKGFVLSDFELGDAFKDKTLLNGKIVAECDFEVEEHKETTIDWLCMSLREKIIFGRMCRKANIDELECLKYANKKPLYAIHIKNLHIFDKPREISEYSKRIGNDFQVLGNAPQNMMKCCEIKYMVVDYILISIRPEWLCKILNGEKTIEVRKKVLKGYYGHN